MVFKILYQSLAYHPSLIAREKEWEAAYTTIFEQMGLKTQSREGQSGLEFPPNLQSWRGGIHRFFVMETQRNTNTS